jgi:4-alpha-glucanotransferase
MIDYRTALHRLARHARIDLNWRDIWGVRHEVPLDSLAALLGAMGLPAQSEPIARATLRDCRRARTGLPPTLVVDPGATALVPLPQDFGARDWVLELESGEEHRGRLAAGAGTLRLPVPLPEGYHRLRFVDGGSAGTSLIAAPRQCYLPEKRSGRDWGLAVQLYSLRSDRQWGIGDFTDLAALMTGVAAIGGCIVGISPLHALSPAIPERISPYWPSSRLFLNPLYLDIAAIPDFAECTELQAAMAGEAVRRTLADLAAVPLVDYPGVARLKSAAFARLWRSFRSRHLSGSPSARGSAFRRFQAEGGAPLARFAQFHALQAQLLETHGPAWCNWPAALRDPLNPAVAQFAARHADDIEQHQYLQWEAERQLAQTAAAPLPCRMYRDLAVGTDPYGAESWSAAGRYLGGASIGAPPDLLNGKGQNWGVTTFSPAALRNDGYAVFIETLRANMRCAGGLRIDHVMGLKQLFFIPEGMPSAAGAYIRYPFQDLVRILALESRRHRCFVVGEDLGTVPRGFRAAMSRAGILSCRVLPFERRRDGGFKSPDAYPALAAASAGTHDLPPLKAWWLGRDIRLRDEAGQYQNAAARAGDETAREHDRRQLLSALCRQHLLSAAQAATLLPEAGPPAFDEVLIGAVHRYLMLTPARFVLFQAEDLLGCEAMVNIPGTVEEHPNWRRRLPASIPALLARHGR